MNNKVRIVIFCSIIALILLIICHYIFYNIEKGAMQAEKEFQKSKEYLSCVVQQLQNESYNEIWFDFINGEMHVTLEDGAILNEDFDKEKIGKAIDELHQKYKYTGVNKKDEMIYFYKSLNLDDSFGIVYAPNKDSIQQIEFLTYLEPLTDSNWYYYEAYFNEWKQRNGK